MTHWFVNTISLNTVVILHNYGQAQAACLKQPIPIPGWLAPVPYTAYRYTHRVRLVSKEVDLLELLKINETKTKCLVPASRECIKTDLPPYVCVYALTNLRSLNRQDS